MISLFLTTSSCMVFCSIYNSASFEAKKMIVNRMIARVDVKTDYKLHISFRFDLNRFYYGA